MHMQTLPRQAIMLLVLIILINPTRKGNIISMWVDKNETKNTKMDNP